MKRFQGLLYAVLSSATFGMIPLFAVPVLRSGMPTSSLLFYRMFFSVLLMGIWIALRGSSLRITRRQLLTILGLSLFYTASSLFLLESYLYLPSGVATTIHFLYPVFVTLLMVTVFREKVSVAMFLAVSMAVVGVWMLSTGSGKGAMNLLGLGFVLITVIAYGSYIVFVNKSCASQVDGIAMTFYVLLFTCLFCGINLGMQGASLVSITNWETGVNILLLALIPTLLSNLFLILAIHRVGSTVTSVLGCMEPLTAVGIGVFFLGELLTPFQYLGIVVILIAVALVIWNNRRKR